MQKSPQLVNISCDFNKLEQTFVAGESIAGTIIVEPNYDLEFKSIRYSICYTTKSKFNSYKENEVHLDVLKFTSNTWNKGREYSYPFKKIINQPTSYKGHLFDIEWKLKIYIVFTNDVKKIAQQVALRTFDIKRVVFPSINLIKSFPFKVLVGQKKQQTVAIQQSFTHKKHITAFVIPTVIGILGVIFNLKGILGLPVPIFEIIGSLSLIFAVRHIILGFGKFEEFTFEVLPSQIGPPYFPVKFTADGKWNTIKYFSAFYSVSERKYSNNSSTSTRYESKKIHQLAKMIQKEVTGNETILLMPFPRKTDVPVSLIDENFRIEWEMDAMIQLNNGRKKKYRFKFLTFL